MKKRIILALITIILPSWALPKTKANAQTVEKTKKSRYVSLRGQTFTARAKASSRDQAIRVAHQRAAGYAGGRPYHVINERVYGEQNKFVCILTCELL